MNTLQQAETSLILDYFDIRIVKNETIVTLSLKDAYKSGKSVPIKKVRPNGQKVVETGLKYYQHYLGNVIGKDVYSIRKKLYNMYTLLNWAQNTIEMSTNDRQRMQEKLDIMHRRNSSGLLDHYASDAGVTTRLKLVDRSKKWAATIGQMNAERWKDKVFRNAEMKRRSDSCFYTRLRDKMIENYSDPTYRKMMLDKANDPKRTAAISIASRKMWKTARSSNSELIRRMTNLSGGKKNFEVRGIKMNSIEYLMAQTLDAIGIDWIYGNIVNVGENTYIPDFIIPSKRLIVECYGDYWHATPRLFEPDQLLHHAIKAQDVWKKDQKRIDDLASVGYTCLTFWETDINNNLDNIKQQILNELDNANK